MKVEVTSSQDTISSTGDLSSSDEGESNGSEELEEIDNSSSGFFSSPSTAAGVSRGKLGFANIKGCVYLAPLFRKVIDVNDESVASESGTDW